MSGVPVTQTGDIPDRGLSADCLDDLGEPSSCDTASYEIDEASGQGIAKTRKDRRTLMSLAKRIHRGQLRHAWAITLPDNASESLFAQRFQADEVRARKNLHAAKVRIKQRGHQLQHQDGEGGR